TVALVYVVNAVLAQAAVMAGMLRAMEAGKHGDEAARRAFAEIFTRVEGLWLPFAISQGIAVLLLAAAVSRRLHDCGRSGAWGLLPLPFLVFGIWQMPTTFQFAPGTVLAPAYPWAAAIVTGPLTFAALAALGVLLARKGTAGPNRFGEDPRKAP
ncbi:MAG TPA: DUF805 domain-containing protein, partial [Allosphingosinicella sp.]|nr:DUF805 domain-containing protein [Allosphingosinicella sp.]